MTRKVLGGVRGVISVSGFLVCLMCPVMVPVFCYLGLAQHTQHENRLALLASGKIANASILGRKIESFRRGETLFELMLEFPSSRGLVTGLRAVPANRYYSATASQPVTVTYLPKTPDTFVIGDARQEFASEPKRLDPSYLWFSIALTMVVIAIFTAAYWMLSA